MDAKLPLSVPLNPVLQHLPVYQPGRPIEEVARELGLAPEGIIKMASNENPLGPSPAAMKAMQKVLPQLHLYPDGNAFYLKERTAKKLGVNPTQLTFGNGSNELLELVAHAVMAPGDEVIVSQYCFAVYPIVTHLFGATLVTVPARKYGHDLPAILKAITPRTKVIFIANPNNPTGTLASRAEVLQLVHETPANVLMVMDEAYIDFLEDPVDLLPYIRNERHPNLLLCRTFSKIYGLAGLRLGYAIGHAEVIGALEKTRQPFNTNMMAQVGALAALDDQEHIQKTRANNQAGLKFFESNFKRLKLEYIPSFANFILVKVKDGQRVCAEIQKRGVITRPLGVYQLPEWLRITIGTPAENERCLAALSQVLARKPGGQS